VDQFVDKAADLGFEGVLLMAKRPHLSLLDYGAAARDRLRQRLESRRMRAVYVAGYTNFTADYEHREVPQIEYQIHCVTELARLAHDLGGNMVRVFTAYEHPACDYGAAWNLVVKALKECAQRAAEYGVVIGVQNHHDVAVGYESQFDLIQAIGEPNCQALFDAWAPVLHGADLTAAARRMAPMTFHTTIANYQFRPRYKYDSPMVNYVAQTPAVQAVPIDEGFIDYAAFLSSMRASGFKGSVAYEMCSPLLGGGGEENLDHYARRFLQFFEGFRRTVVREAGVSALV
jgi:sugar phosphate isomerase/epimerase